MQLFERTYHVATAARTWRWIAFP